MPIKQKKQQMPQRNIPRKNLNRGNAFIDEAGQPDANTSEDAKQSFTKSESGWQPMMASLKSKAIFDPGFSQNYHGSSPLIGAGTDSAEARSNTGGDTKDDVSEYDSTYNYKDNSKFPLRFRKDTTEPKQKIKSKKSGGFSMKALQKRAEERKARIESIYSMEDNYAAYGRFCSKNTCVGVWKELLGFEDRKKLNIERTSEVWRCPKCKEVTEANGSIADQTSGFSAFNTYNDGPIANEKDFEPTKISPDKDRTKR